MAATYFVSAAGNDSNGGTAAGSPFLTVGHVNGLTLSSGDTVSFKSGDTFQGPLTLQSGVTYTTYGGSPAALINAGDTSGAPVVSGAGRGWGVAGTNVGGWTLRNLKFVGSGVNTTTGFSDSGNASAGVASPDNNEIGIGINAQWTTHAGTVYAGVTLDGCEFTGFYTGGLIHAEPASGNPDVPAALTVTSNLFHDCLNNGLYVFGGNPGVKEGGRWGIYHGSFFPNVYVAHNQAYNVPGDPNTVLGGGSGLTIANCSGGPFEYNVVHDCGGLMTSISGAGLGGGSAGIAATECSGVTLQYNEVYNLATPLGIDACAIDLDSGCVNCIAQYNYTHENFGPGFQITTFNASYVAANNTIRNNVSLNDCRNPHSSKTLGAITLYGSTGTSVHDNLVLLPNLAGAAHAPAFATAEHDGVDVVATITSNTVALGSSNVLSAVNGSAQSSFSVSGNTSRTMADSEVTFVALSGSVAQSSRAMTIATSDSSVATPSATSGTTDALGQLTITATGVGVGSCTFTATCETKTAARTVTVS